MKLLTEATDFHRDTSNLGCLVGRHLHQIGCAEEAIKVFEELIVSRRYAPFEDEAIYLALVVELARSYLSNSQAPDAIGLLEHCLRLGTGHCRKTTQPV